jgi:hypothetical protein
MVGQITLRTQIRLRMSARRGVNDNAIVRDDNRPENLELWTRPQPSGIRASDAVAWAREILERYTGD